MIELKFVDEEKPVSLDLMGESGSGTSNYDDLENKPKINGVELQGDLTLKDLGIIVKAVTDVLMNGASIVDKNGVVNIPIASRDNLGTVKINGNYGVLVENATGALFIDRATESHIDDRNNQWKPITPRNLDYAVKQAMTDGKGQAWTSEEKAMARARMGMEWRLIDTVEASDVAQVEILFPQEYDEFMIIADISGNGNLIIHPHTCYNVNDNGVIQARQMLHSAYYPSDKTEHLELTFEKAYIDNDIYFRISGYEETDYAWNLNKNIQTTGWAQAYDIANTKPCFAWYMVKFQRTITNATFKIYAR